MSELEIESSHEVLVEELGADWRLSRWVTVAWSGLLGWRKPFASQVRRKMGAVRLGSAPTARSGLIEFQLHVHKVE